MSTTSDAHDQIRTVTRALERTRDALSTALIEPELNNGTESGERHRIEDLHRRISGAISALHGKARDH